MHISFDRIKFKKRVYEDITVSLRKYLAAEFNPDCVPVYRFNISDRFGDEVGNIEFRAGNTQAIANIDGHVGYSIVGKNRGNNYAYKACKAIMPFIALHKLEILVLTADCGNVASNRIIDKLGATLCSKNESVGKNIYQIQL